MRRHSGRLRIQSTLSSAEPPLTRAITAFTNPDPRALPLKQFTGDFILTFEELSVFFI